MKILQLVRRSEGGLKNHVLTLARELDRSRYDMEIAASFDDRETGCLKELGIRYFPLDICDGSSPGRIWEAAEALKKLVGDEGIDLVHAHGFVAGLTAQLSGEPCIMTIHNFPPDRGFKAFGFRHAEMRFGARMLGSIAVSQALRDSAGSMGIDRSRIRVIYNGIDDGLFQERRAVLREEYDIGGDRLIICVARLVRDKGVEYFIRAASLLARERDNVYFIVIGDGPQAGYLKGLAGELGLADRLIFAGYRENAGMLISGCDMFVLPSLKEGLGVSLLEAMASRVPCVASRAGGIPEALCGGLGGILVRPGDYMELYAAMKYLLDNPDKSEEIAEKGYDIAKNGFRSADMIRNTEEFYDDIGRQL